MNKRTELLKELSSKLQVRFNDIQLLDVALSHSSLLSENKSANYYERLEFLGDSVLQLCISEELYSRNKNKTEGELSKARALIVCENSLCEIARSFDIGKYINMSRGEELTGGRTRTSILADIIEAIIAAIYLDIGLDEARRFILHNFDHLISKSLNNEITSDYKTKLQEMIQKHGKTNIEYRLINYEGPPHKRIFHVAIFINDLQSGTGTGLTKKEAEQNAAKEAVLKMEKKHEK